MDRLALLLVTGILISAVLLLGKAAAAAGLPPLTPLLWQVAGGGALILALAALRGDIPRTDRRHLRYYALSGLLGVTLPYALTYWVLLHLQAGLLALLTALSTLFTLVLARLLGMESLRPVRVAGLLLGLAGVAAILLPRLALPGAGALGWAALALLVPLSLALANIYRTRAWPVGSSALSLAAGTLLVQALGVGAVGLLAGAIAWPAAEHAATAWALPGIALLSALTILGTFTLQRIGGPVYLSQLGYVITAATLVLGASILGERYPAPVFAATALIAAGLLLVNGRQRRATMTVE